MSDSEIKQNSNKPVGSLLTIGIIFLPLIFAWVTLRSGYSKRSRVASFSWAIIPILIAGMAGGANSQKTSSPTSQSNKAPIVCNKFKLFATLLEPAYEAGYETLEF